MDPLFWNYMQQDITIRPLQLADIETAVAIVEENYPGDPDVERARLELQDAFRDVAMQPRFLVCVDDQGEMLGFGGYVESWMNYHMYELFWINVRKAHQGQGIGTQIAKALVKDIRERDPEAKWIMGTTTSLGFYEKLGEVQKLPLGDDDYLVLKKF